MNKRIKILAYYLPQFHEIEENNRWWGKGFTEWVNVTKATSLFEGHRQPRVPLNKNYYDLSNIDTMRWQVGIAKQYGLYGFCFYHYWFDNRPLLEQPLENYLAAEDIDFPFCFCWANESWTNGWAKANSSIIMEQKYGDEPEWKQHFNYLLPFLKDKRYIKENNAPLIVIYRPYLFDRMIQMLEYWKKLAIEEGFSGLKVASQRFENPQCDLNIYDYLDYHISYEPGTAKTVIANSAARRSLGARIHNFLLKKFNVDISIRRRLSGPVKFDYDEIWKDVLQRDHDLKSIAGAFVNWDNTPRHGRRGTVFVNVSPEKFKQYMKMQVNNVLSNYENEYLFVFAWNEWGEGGILEPDEENGYSYLEAIRDAVE